MKPVIAKSHQSKKVFVDRVELSEKESMDIETAIGQFSIRQTISFLYTEKKMEWVDRTSIHFRFVTVLGELVIPVPVAEKVQEYLEVEHSQYEELESLDVVLKRNKWVRAQEAEKND
jgi:hypothetical protein